MTKQNRLPLVMLISGNGSNLQAVIDAVALDLPVDIRAVISNKADAYGLERARNAGIEAWVLDHTQYPDRESYDQVLAELVASFKPGLVILAGFMRILSPHFVNKFRGQLLNIHPSLLPKYRGLHTHQRALDAGDLVHGASVHFVTEELDGGPLVLQIRLPIENGDDEEKLAKKVLSQEHIIYPAVIRWFADGRLRMKGNSVSKDGVTLKGPLGMRYHEAPPA